MGETREAESLLASDLHVEATYRLTEALVESENRMLRRVDLLCEVVFETDRMGHLVFLNRAWRATTGHTVDSSLGAKLCDFVIEDDCAACAEIMTSAIARDGACLRLLHADGSVIWMEISVTRMSDGGLVGALHNVTSRKKAEEELAKLSLVASYTDNLVIIADKDGLTEWVNPAFIARTGYGLADMYGKKPGSILQGPDTDPETVAWIGSQIRAGRSCSAELLNYTRKGETYWMSMQITPIRGIGGNIERFISVQTDITAMRQTGIELEEAKKRAESANDAKTQFLATISHEMRTPLNAILGSTDLALDGNVNDLVLQSHLNRIDENAQILLRFISDMLEVSKIEAGQIDLEFVPVQLKNCMDSVIGPLSVRAREKGLEFFLKFDDTLPIWIMSDADRLRQIVGNLVENAIKFTDMGSIHVVVSRFECEFVREDRLMIQVLDTGIGIDPNERDRIFLRFERGDTSMTRSKGGAGLGLSIVKSLTEALGGQVSVKSRIERGTEFIVDLPLVKAPERGVSQSSEVFRRIPECETSSRTQTRILVAEDTNANFAIVEIFLQKAGYQVIRAYDGRDAVAGAADADLILMDIEMPEMDGLEATRLIRTAERREGRVAVPILALTAHAIQGYRDSCIEAGCNGYLTKPIRKEGLIQSIETVLWGEDTGASQGRLSNCAQPIATK